MLIDTHSHIHNPENFPDPSAEVAAAKEAGVERIIVVGCEPQDWTMATAFAEKHDEVFAICGWHPNYTANYDPIDLPILIRVLKHPKVLAIGEIGLDYHWDYAPVTLQRKALKDQLRLGEETGKPIVFHAREAYSDLLDILETLPRQKYLFHCFAGTKEDARRALRLGAYFGCNGPITYKKADELRSVFSFIPPHKIVLETDAPYMAPVPHRGKPNRPAYIPILNKALAELHNMTQDEMAAQTTQNAIDFFGPALA